MGNEPIIQLDLTSKEDKPSLRSIWIEIPPSCDLHCHYCFAKSNTPRSKNLANLTIGDYENIFKQFQKEGGIWVGIPGAGEPFYSENLKITKEIIRLCSQECYDLQLTIFSTGHCITEELAHQLFEQRHVNLMIKWNSSKPEIQNRLVGDETNTYFAKRQVAWGTLLRIFDNQRARLGIVTSILSDNYRELPDLLSYARSEGIVFDCDTLLPKGLGINCECAPTPNSVRQTSRELCSIDKKFGNVWQEAGAYIGCSCNRYLHHLYIDYTGEVYPCLGLFEIPLGNIKDNALNDIWQHPARQAIAHRTITGACATCERFINKSCSSCMGRNIRKKDHENSMLSRGWIFTYPCNIYVPDFSIGLQAATMLARNILSDRFATRYFLEESLESIWNPAFTPAGVEQNEVISSKDNEKSEQASLDIKRIISLDIPPVKSSSKSKATFAQWSRDVGVSSLFSQISSIALLGDEDNYFYRIIFSTEGYPIKEEINKKDWIDSEIYNVNPIVECIMDIYKEYNNLRTAISKELDLLLNFQERKIAGEKRLSPNNSLTRYWNIEDTSIITNSDKKLPAPKDDSSIHRFDIVHKNSGYRISLESTWIKKNLFISDMPYPWDNWLDTKSGQLDIFTRPSSNGYYYSGIPILLPRLLIPLISLVIEKHPEINAPLWILWLFYDPCKNSYFRRLLHFGTLIESTLIGNKQEQWNALKLIYMWPEFSPDIDKGVCFDENILNLSDVLRNPLVDYELIDTKDELPRRGLGAIRFNIGAIIKEVKSFSKELVETARQSEFTNNEWMMLDSIPFSELIGNREVLLKLRDCYKKMTNKLIHINNLPNYKVYIKQTYELIPLELRKHILDADHNDIHDEIKRKSINYFIFLGALNILGAKHYYVGQAITNKLITDRILKESQKDWNITPCGFIIASEQTMPDSFIGEVALVYSSVMGPIVEFYARWTSDYDVDRALMVRNMPCLQRLPKHYIKKSLHNRNITPDINRIINYDNKDDFELKYKNDLKWIRQLPKADLHVHLGPAIPIDVLYDLSAISLFLWDLQGSKRSVKQCGETLTKIVRLTIGNIKNKIKGNNSKIINTDLFKDEFIDTASKELKKQSINSVDGVIREMALASEINKNQCACILNVVLGNLVRDQENWEISLKRRIDKLQNFYFFIKKLKETENGDSKKDALTPVRNIIASAYLTDYDRIDRLLVKYSQVEDQNIFITKIKSIVHELRMDERIEWVLEWGDPLSNLLSIPRCFEKKAHGLMRYLGSSDLTGSSVLQFYETLILSIIEIAVHASKTDNVRYMELKLSPSGLVGTVLGEEQSIISVALLSSAFVSYKSAEWLIENKDIYWIGEKHNEKWPFILSNIIIVGNRKSTKEHLRNIVLQAVDSREHYFKAIWAVQNEFGQKDNNHIATTSSVNDIEKIVGDLFIRGKIDIIVPRVVGIDLVGLERGVKHSDFEESMIEAFEKCILVTIHAGEDESDRSIWEAIYSLHAQRIGHGLRLSTTENLSHLIRDKRIPLELCPVSNQYTNGYLYNGYSDYVFDKFKAEHMTLTINTDDPWISHRVTTSLHDQIPPYPLSDEFLVLPLLFKSKQFDNGPKFGKLTRLEILGLIFNAFDNAFLPAPDRDALLAFADLETFLIISKYDLKYWAFQA